MEYHMKVRMALYYAAYPLHSSLGEYPFHT